MDDRQRRRQDDSVGARADGGFDTWRAVAHPVWLGALALLLLNDHYLKGSGLLPGAVTGKLSDLAGMLVAPALLAALLRVRTGRGLALAHVATGLVFAAIKLSPAAAAAFAWLTALTPFPWRITVDPTDLFAALPALALSYPLFGAVAARPRPVRPAVVRLAAVAGAYACVATSPQRPVCQGDVEQADGTCGPGASDAYGAFVVANQAGTEIVLHVRALRPEVTVECDALLDDPSLRLAPELFEPAESWLLDANRALPLEEQAGRQCSAYVVSSGGGPAALVAWRHWDYPETELWTVASGNPEERLLFVTAAANVATSGAHVVFPPPAEQVPGPAAGCELLPDTVGIAWTEPPVPASQLLVAVTSSPDGCHLLELASGQSLYVCLPAAAALFTPGSTVSIYESGASAGSPRLVIETPAGRVELGRGYQWPSAAAVTFEVTDVPSCGGSRDACGSWGVPLTIWAHDGEETASASSGGALATTSLGSLHVVRAERRPICDTSCGIGALAAGTTPYLEWAHVMPAPAPQP
ncbi:MAG: hypothetical protein HY908_31315 [Myxococcales bacterium]|nr:hypothetical protein [Myxococcales bacterium]